MRPVDVIVILALIVCAVASALGFFEDETPVPDGPSVPVEQPRRPMPEGPALPPPDVDRDPVIHVRTEEKSGTSVGTAFSLDADGIWMTARHVVEGCDRVGLVTGPETAVRVREIWSHPSADLAILSETISRPALISAERLPTVGETGYGVGFPRGQPGDVAGTLMGRATSVALGAERRVEPILVWSEQGRFPSFHGSLAGISGGPLLAADGRVIGVIISGEPRRGRFNTAAPRSLASALNEAALSPSPSEPRFDFTRPIERGALPDIGDRMRATGTVSQVICIAA